MTMQHSLPLKSTNLLLIVSLKYRTNRWFSNPENQRVRFTADISEVAEEIYTLIFA